MELREYASKREFEKTPEPKPGLGRKGYRPIFVVHKHAARALHYDLRLELQGMLKSWAVPKGPSLDPSLKRMAVMVEDHPLITRILRALSRRAVTVQGASSSGTGAFIVTLSHKMKTKAKDFF